MFKNDVSNLISQNLNLMAEMMGVLRQNIRTLESISEVIENVSAHDKEIARNLDELNKSKKSGDSDVTDDIIRALRDLVNVVSNMERRITELERKSGHAPSRRGRNDKFNSEDLFMRMLAKAILEDAMLDDDEDDDDFDDDDFETIKEGNTTIKKMVVDSPEKFKKMFNIIKREGGSDAVDELLDDLNKHNFFDNEHNLRKFCIDKEDRDNFEDKTNDNNDDEDDE